MRTLEYELLRLADRFGGEVRRAPDGNNYEVKFKSSKAERAYRREVAKLIRRHDARQQKISARIWRLRLQLVWARTVRALCRLRDLATGRKPAPHGGPPVWK